VGLGGAGWGGLGRVGAGWGGLGRGGLGRVGAGWGGVGWLWGGVGWGGGCAGACAAAPRPRAPPAALSPPPHVVNVAMESRNRLAARLKSRVYMLNTAS
jgi:hypothetical protein